MPQHTRAIFYPTLYDTEGNLDETELVVSTRLSWDFLYALKKEMRDLTFRVGQMQKPSRQVTQGDTTINLAKAIGPANAVVISDSNKKLVTDNEFLYDTGTNNLRLSGRFRIGDSVIPTERLELTGAILIGPSDIPATAADGTIRYTAADSFEGRHLGVWSPFAGHWTRTTGTRNFLETNVANDRVDIGAVNTPEFTACVMFARYEQVDPNWGLGESFTLVLRSSNLDAKAVGQGGTLKLDDLSGAGCVLLGGDDGFGNDRGRFEVWCRQATNPYIRRLLITSAGTVQLFGPLRDSSDVEFGSTSPTPTTILTLRSAWTDPVNAGGTLVVASPATGSQAAGRGGTIQFSDGVGSRAVITGAPEAGSGDAGSFRVYTRDSAGGLLANHFEVFSGGDLALGGIRYDFPAADGASGDRLTTDGAGNLSWSGVVINTGTPLDNQVAIWTAASTLEGDPSMVFDGDQLALTTQGVTGGILIGDDAQLYRSAADILRTPDQLIVDTGLLVGSGSLDTSAGIELDSTTQAILFSRMNTTERDALTGVAGMVIWNTTTTQLERFNGTSWAAIAGAGGGNVSNTGTPLNNQVAVWTNATTIEGDPDFTFDGTNLVVTGSVTAGTLNLTATINQIVLDSDAANTGTITMAALGASRVWTLPDVTTTIVGRTGTPANNQLATWVSANEVQGEANLTFDGSILTLVNSELRINDINVETLAADKTISAGDPQIQRLDPNGADRNVDLPPEVSGLILFIFNSGSSKLTVREDSGSTSIAAVAANQSGIFISDGTNWESLVGDRNKL